MIPDDVAEALLAQLDRKLNGINTQKERAAISMELIAEKLPHYQWVGVYWLQDDELLLGPFVGAETEHRRIPVGQGVCGSAVSENKNQVVDDVRELSNYLACSLQTRSEIVVLIRDEQGKIIGQIDADGHRVHDFDATDEAFLQQVASRIAAV